MFKCQGVLLHQFSSNSEFNKIHMHSLVTLVTLRAHQRNFFFFYLIQKKKPTLWKVGLEVQGDTRVSIDVQDSQMGKTFPFAEVLIGSFDIDNGMATTSSQIKNLIGGVRKNNHNACVPCGTHCKEIPYVLWKRTWNTTIAVLMTAWAYNHKSLCLCVEFSCAHTSPLGA